MPAAAAVATSRYGNQQQACQRKDESRRWAGPVIPAHPIVNCTCREEQSIEGGMVVRCWQPSGASIDRWSMRPGMTAQPPAKTVAKTSQRAESCQKALPMRTKAISAMTAPKNRPMVAWTSTG
jgi:hypothetical protein